MHLRADFIYFFIIILDIIIKKNTMSTHKNTLFVSKMAQCGCDGAGYQRRSQKLETALCMSFLKTQHLNRIKYAKDNYQITVLLSF